ncbi:MAG: tRNA lysidine(34) synthetase TilS [Burkholderiaceae bacterium]|nr:tRNA lysidine(34) synthetase TilS [Burkholderiaceae bacterium]
MADSATPRTADSEADFEADASSAVPGAIAVAYSGGLDSTALLHTVASACAAMAAEFGTAPRVFGLHVHHGLSPNADDWLRHCETQVQHWAAQGLPVALLCRRLAGEPQSGESVEAWARMQRYAALSDMARECGAKLLLLAHHRRDQAETFLLQALRGAGPAGLAGMPARQWRDGLCWTRPWLQQPREAIEAYVRAKGLSHIEDESNTDRRYARNRLRLEVWPALRQAFDHAESSLARAGQWAQQSLALQQEVAESDLVQWMTDAGLPLAALLELSEARAANLLRHWLALGLRQPAPTTLVQRLLTELPQTLASGRTARWPAGEFELELYRDVLSLRSLPVPVEHAAELTLDLSCEGVHPCPGWQGAWQVQRVEQGGVAPDLLARAQMRVRRGGEQFQQHTRSMPRSLKKSWQAAGVPVSGRAGPLLFAQDRLLWVPGLGCDARMLAPAGQVQLSLSWRPER